MFVCYLDLKITLDELSSTMEDLCSPEKMEEEVDNPSEYREKCRKLPPWVSQSRKRITWLTKNVCGRTEWYCWPSSTLSEIGQIALDMMAAILPGNAGALEGLLVSSPMGDGEILELSWKWAMVAAQCGNAMGELGSLVLLGRMQPRDGGGFLREAFEFWEKRFQDPDSHPDLYWGKRKKLCWDLTCELGLQAAFRLRDSALASRVINGFSLTGEVGLSLFPLYSQVARLCPPKPRTEAGEPARKRVLMGIQPGEKEEEQLKRYRSLLRPIPLAPWPETRYWTGVLQKEFPWMRAAIDALERQQVLGLRLGQKILGFRPLLLLGPAGVGKTRFLRRLGELLSTPAVFISLAGSADNMMLKGTARGWSSARAGYLVEQFLNFQTANPLVILDEIDKVGTGRTNGRIWETLLTMIEPSSSASVMDEFLMAPVDCSAVNWVATANSLEEIPEPLRSRWEIIWCGMPQGDDFDGILENLLQDMAKENSVAKDDLPQLDGQVMDLLRSSFQENPRSMRVLRRTLHRLMELEAMAAAETMENRWLQ